MKTIIKTLTIALISSSTLGLFASSAVAATSDSATMLQSNSALTSSNLTWQQTKQKFDIGRYYH
ncbi:hypothetical protein [Celerinatantimonas yamalensis]|uniref:Uncharacterized protein n=1 Tax=Celerinatantimonas yamalensis TaxID=559956 RepID=A0ABW9GAK9_9GAMM